MSVAIWPDDGSGKQPDWTQAALASGTIDLTAGTSNRTASIGVTVPPGTWHLVGLYVETNTTGLTRATGSTVNGATGYLPSNNAASATRVMQATGQSAMPSGGTGPALTPAVQGSPWLVLSLRAA